MILPLQETSEPGSLETQSFLRWLDAPPAWIIGLVLIPLLVGVVWWTYRRGSTLTRQQRIILSAFRVIGLLLILVASFRPALEITRNLKIRTEVHFLVDDSASMKRHETYDENRAAALKAALGTQAPDDLTDIDRLDLVARLLGAGGEGAAERASGPGRELLEALAKNFDVRWFRFWDRSYPINDLAELSGEGASTRIGDSIDLHLANHSVDSSRLEAIVLVTDGRNNEGLAPLESAARLKAAEVPLHVLGVGDPGNESNLVLAGPPGPQQVLQNEEAVFELTVTAKGLPQRSFNAILRAYRKSPTAEGEGATDERTLAQGNFSLPKVGESAKVTLRCTFPEPGDWILTFEVPPLPGETNPKDNTTRRYLRVDSDRIRVLYVEDRPRWEYRYLKNALKRVDKSIEVQCWLFDASRSFLQEASEGLPSLSALPATREELMKYHVVLLGDVPPSRLGPTEEARAKWLEGLKDFVERGGGLGVIAGNLAMPESYRETTLEDLLPVVIGDLAEEELPASRGDAFVPALESPHAPHPIVKLHEEDATNRRLWTDGLEGMTWYYPVLRAKAGASVLLRHPVDENKYGRRIVLATAPYPKGSVMFIAVDETWRWRKFYGEKYQDKFWRNIVRALAENKLRRMDDRVTLTVDQEEVDVGTRIRVELQLLDEDYNPVLDESARLFVRLPSGQLQAIRLPRLQGQPGKFETLLPLPDAGVYSLLFYKNEEAQGRPLARQDVIARVPRKELQETTLDEPGLIALAKAAGGRYAPIDRMTDILEGFVGRGLPVKTVDRKTREIWDRALTVLLVLLFLTGEWILRKRWRMV